MEGRLSAFLRVFAFLRWPFLSLDIYLFEEKESRFPRGNNVQVPVTVHVQNRDLHASSSFASEVDDVFDVG